jgi:hypothetical protein
LSFICLFSQKEMLLQKAFIVNPVEQNNQHTKVSRCRRDCKCYKIV